MTRRVAAIAWLLFVWLALTGSVSPANVALGLAAGTALLLFFRPTGEVRAGSTFRPWHALRFIAFFTVKFLYANIQVALAVIWPERVRHTRAVVAVPIVDASETTTILLANAVSLTPGTFILEMRSAPPTMYVHVLKLSTLRALRLEILDLERRIVQAFGPAGSADRVKSLMARVAAETDM